MRVISAARTGPNPALRFGAVHDGIDQRGRADCSRLRASWTPDGHAGRVLCGPETSVVQTAAELGFAAETVPGLRTLDLGDWSDRRPDELEPAVLGSWFADPDATPHRGESVRDFVERLQGLSLPAEVATIVVAKPVAQALRLLADGGDPTGFFAVEVQPLQVLTLDVTS
ncbi:histidine phosphatase family protein [Williamsia sterculiae]|nr:histidine phosphatase family protein [Williamsia sterculiae]